MYIDDMWHCYRACGLRLRSPLALPLVPAEAGTDDVVIEQRMTMDRAAPSGCEGTPDRVTLIYPNIGRFVVQSGKEVIVPPVRDERLARTIAAITLGTALPHLCHQRGLVALHAATVLLNGQAVALAGPVTIGKSTLLDAFIRAGHRFMADDLCAVELPPASLRGNPAGIASSPGSLPPGSVRGRDDGAAIAYPCGPWVKLRDDAGNNRHVGAARFKAPGSKTWVDLTGQFHAEPAPLAAILLITDGGRDDAIHIERLTGIEALTATPLVVSRWRQAKASQGLAVLADRLIALFNLAPLYRLRRPRTLDRLDEVVVSVERFAEQSLGVR